MEHNKYLTVTALTKYIKKKFDVDKHLNPLLLRGELSNFKHHSRGHMYMTVKDDHASIRAVMFHRQNQKLKFRPENGMKVLLEGYISVFEQAGQYQLYINEMQPDGVGALHLAFEQLKEKLATEGLFESIHKQALPKYPKQITILTSPTGAAIRDILITLERRYPLAKLLVIPVLVQGSQSAPSIVEAIEKANKIKETDLIILGRGGGSLEELWSFNEEAVARAIFHSKKPIVSAVGHETDFTISDMVADLRAPTPTAAAELAVPSQFELLEKLEQLNQALRTNIHYQLRQYRSQLRNLEQSYVFKYPERLLEEKEQQLDRLLEKQATAAKQMIKQKHDKLLYINQRFQQYPYWQNLNQQMDKVSRLQLRLEQSMKHNLERKKQNFSRKLTELDLLNPMRIMERGYSITYSEDYHIIYDTKQVNREDILNIQLVDGQIECKVQQIKKEENK